MRSPTDRTGSDDPVERVRICEDRTQVVCHDRLSCLQIDSHLAEGCRGDLVRCWHRLIVAPLSNAQALYELVGPKPLKAFGKRESRERLEHDVIGAIAVEPLVE
jgi:hypothetical protein